MKNFIRSVVLLPFLALTLSAHAESAPVAIPAAFSSMTAGDLAFSCSDVLAGGALLLNGLPLEKLQMSEPERRDNLMLNLTTQLVWRKQSVALGVSKSRRAQLHRSVVAGGIAGIADALPYCLETGYRRVARLSKAERISLHEKASAEYLSLVGERD